MKAARAPAASQEILVLEAPLSGWAAPLDEVADPVFAERMLGDGVAIDPVSEVLHAPCDGVVIALPASRHAVTLRAGNGAELLMHVGLETVALAGEGFRAHVAEGQAVRRGEALLTFQMDTVARRARSLATPVVVANGEAFEIMSRVTGREVRQGEPLMELRPLRVGVGETEAAGGSVETTSPLDLPHGLHARPAARIAAAMKIFRAEVEIGVGDRRADARSAVALMALGATSGASLAVRARGPDADAAIARLRAVLAEIAHDELAEPVAPPAPKPASVTGALPGVLRGVTAAPGMAIGLAVRYRPPEPLVREAAQEPDVERRALDVALAQVASAIGAQASDGPSSRRDILAAHEAFLDDPELRRAAEARIAAGASAGVAWRDAVRAQAAALTALSDARLAQRAEDLLDLERQVLLALSGDEAQAPAIPRGAIVIADELLPSQLLALEAAGGFCTAQGGATSHVAILAAAMGAPALCAMGPALDGVPDRVAVILDADAGYLRIAPDPASLAAAQAALAEREASRQAAQAAAGEPCRLADGTRIEVFANLGAAGEAAGAAALGAEGCGLFRTEFLYLDRGEAPGVEAQHAAYQAAADGLGDRPLVIRTLDAGGDKPLAFAPAPPESNPALGLRGVRASLRQPALLADQLAAILRVAGPGERRILVPMVTDLGDLRAVRAALDALARETRAAVPKLGVMIETPASALLADQLAGEADFLSVGTNDLTQYVLAMDREHPGLAGRLDGMHPAVLRLVGQAARAAAEHGRPVSVCGGLAADPLAAPLLVGLGAGCLSVPPAAVPALKARLRRFTLESCRTAAQEALRLDSAHAVRALAAERFPLEAIP